MQRVCPARFALLLYSRTRGIVNMAVSTQNDPPAPSPTPPDLPPMRPQTIWRALLLGILLVPINAFWVTVVEVRWYTLDGTSLPLFITPIFFLLALVLLNLAWRRLAPRPGTAFTQAELLLVYVMLVVSCTFAGHDTMQNLFGTVSHPYWYATKDNRWQELFFRYLPNWLLVTNHTALTGFYAGHVSIYSAEGREYLISWIVPLAAWGVFFLTLLGMYLCLTILVRKPWIENEKLTFPLVQLPLALTADDAETAFFRNPRMWIGFGLAGGISLLNGLHELIPTLPSVQIHPYDIHQLVTTRPWSAIGETRSTWYPFAIGIAYFMPLDLSFSCWFFFAASRIFRVVGDIAGMNVGASDGKIFPYFGEQSAGAWLGLGAMLLYTGRGYWRGVWRDARLGRNAADPQEALRGRWAMGGLVVGTVLLGVFARLIGMSLLVGVGFFGIVLLLSFTITRVRAEFGSPHEINWVNPGQILVTVFGTSALGPQNLTALSMLHWFNRGYRNHPMPNQLEAFKMTEDKPGVRFGGIVTVLVVASVVSLLAVYWANLHVVYQAGGDSKAAGFKKWVGEESFAGLASWLTQPQPPATTGLYYFIGGLLFTLFLAVMRFYFVWWPFHPAGYALAFSFAMEYFWVPVFLAWLCKAVILRYGGINAYRAGIPFFLGLILGDYTMGSLWAIIGPLLGIPTYKIFI